VGGWAAPVALRWRGGAIGEWRRNAVIRLFRFNSIAYRVLLFFHARRPKSSERQTRIPAMIQLQNGTGILGSARYCSYSRERPHRGTAIPMAAVRRPMIESQPRYRARQPMPGDRDARIRSPRRLGADAYARPGSHPAAPSRSQSARRRADVRARVHGADAGVEKALYPPRGGTRCVTGGRGCRVAGSLIKSPALPGPGAPALRPPAPLPWLLRTARGGPRGTCRRRGSRTG
jgi:hypothetical protein